MTLEEKKQKIREIADWLRVDYDYEGCGDTVRVVDRRDGISIQISSVGCIDIDTDEIQKIVEMTKDVDPGGFMIFAQGNEYGEPTLDLSWDFREHPWCR